LPLQVTKTSENGLESFFHSETLLAIIIRAEYQSDGISFFTQGSFSQQLAYMKRPQEYKIDPHVHNIVPREITLTQEVLFIRKGLVRLDLYSKAQEYLGSTNLYTGDVVLLADGGHGFHMLEESEIIEVKQGPYLGEADKIRFEPTSDTNIKLL